MNSQCFTLKHTLVDSQQEMDTLVTRYDKAVEDLILRDHNISKLTDDMLEANREIEKLVEAVTEAKKRDEENSKELFEVYGSLRRKEEILRNMEDRLNRKLSEREEQCMTLQSQLNHLEQTFSAETTNREQLKRLYDERSQVGANLENTLKTKDDQLRDMQEEIAALRLAGDRAYRQREEELLEQIQKRNAKEFSLTQETEQLKEMKASLEDQTVNAQKTMEDYKLGMKEMQTELEKKEQALKRWEDEVKRLESAHNCANMQHSDLQKDYERIRQQQIDDAMLIDRMRVA